MAPSKWLIGVLKIGYHVTATTSQFSLKRPHSETTKDGTTCGHEKDSTRSKKQHHDRTSVVTSKSGNESHVTDYLLEQRIRREIQEKTEVKHIYIFFLIHKSTEENLFITIICLQLYVLWFVARSCIEKIHFGCQLEDFGYMLSATTTETLWFFKWGQRKNVDLREINVIEMPVRPTLGIMSTRHNISGARLLIPFRVGTLVTKVTMGT